DEGGGRLDLLRGGGYGLKVQTSKPSKCQPKYPDRGDEPRNGGSTMTGTAKRVAVAAIFAGVVMWIGAGCSREEGKGPAETAGKKIDAAADAAKDAAAGAARTTGDAASAAAGAAKDGAAAAGTAPEDAAGAAPRRPPH